MFFLRVHVIGFDTVVAALGCLHDPTVGSVTDTSPSLSYLLVGLLLNLVTLV